MVATVDHPEFIQPHDINIPLWRYIDLSKFVSLLQKKKLVLPRVDLLGDPFEGSLPMTYQSYIEYISQEGIENNNSIKKEDTEFMSKIRKALTKSLYVSCWHMNEHESFAMWKIYRASNESLSIKTTYKKLRDIIPDSCYIGKVKYVDFSTYELRGSNAVETFLIKRKNFEYEREVRIIMPNNFELTQALKGEDTKPLESIEMPLNELITAIYVSPDSPRWYEEIIVELCEQYGLYAPVRRSTLEGTPYF